MILIFENQSKFKYDASINSWVRKTFAKKFRDRKNELKSTHFDRELRMDVNNKNVPVDVAPYQWQFLVSYWMSDKGKVTQLNTKFLIS